MLGLTGAEVEGLVRFGAASVSLGTAAVVLARARRDDEAQGGASDPGADGVVGAPDDAVAGPDGPSPAADDPPA